MAVWTYLSADLRTNKIVGDLPLSGVRMSKILNGAGQMQANVALRRTNTGAMVRGLLDMTRPAIRAIYALRDSTPWWGGII